jgi:hypothetical protein
LKKLQTSIAVAVMAALVLAGPREATAHESEYAGWPCAYEGWYEVCLMYATSDGPYYEDGYPYYYRYGTYGHYLLWGWGGLNHTHSEYLGWNWG